ncbi:membrane dipeptidase-domain-containing protein [Bisporella sp. PMI_857]|nr:membrane dipeptidase-domain-containing protein [Bisporella sp. PMI_857]
MATNTEKDLLLPRNKDQGASLEQRSPSLSEKSSSTATKALSKFRLLLIICLALILGIFAFKNNGTYYRISHNRLLSIEERVNNILTNTPLIDGHNDLAILLRFRNNNQIYDENFTKPFEEGGLTGHVDLPRLKEGKNGGAFWSAYVPCPKNWADFSDANYAESVAFTLSQIDVLTRLQVAYPAHFSTPPNSSTALEAFKNGLLISPFGIEGLHQIGNSVSNLRHYYALGVRYATLTHNCHNIYADAAITELPHGIVKSRPYWHGVSPAGRDLIKEMNRIGMIVDLSHVSQDTMRDVLGGNDSWAGSAAPIIFSHSSAYSLCPHPRNVPDDILQLVKKRNSVVMVNFSPDFVSCVAGNKPNGLPDFYPPNSTLSHVVEHIKYIGELIGYEHVGLGSDFDGSKSYSLFTSLKLRQPYSSCSFHQRCLIPSTPKGLDDVSKFPDLVAEMLKQGISDKDASKVVGGNVLRVWGDVDTVALKLQEDGLKPLEDKLPTFKFEMNMDGYLGFGNM